VWGCDISEDVLARARAKVPDGEFRVADLAALPYADDSFDTVVACDSLLSKRNARKAVSELSRVANPSGSLCIVIWEEPSKSDYSRILMAMQKLLAQKPPVTPLALSGGGALDRLLRELGLKIRIDRTVRLDYRFADFEDFWSLARLLGGIKLIVEAVGEETVRAAAREAAQQSIRENGELVMNNAYRLVVVDSKRTENAAA
jgi:SAM-dependent methyltransferase